MLHRAKKLLNSGAQEYFIENRPVNVRVDGGGEPRAGEAYNAQNIGLNGKLMLRSRAARASCILLILSMTPVHAIQDEPKKGDAEEKTLFLVARPDLRDPFFKESVVLMFPSSVAIEEGLVAGLILNKPARIALSEIFPNDEALKDRSETVYFGGPVEPRAPGVVFRSSKAAKQATLLFGDIYVSFDPDFIKELLKEPEKTPDLRLFAGRSQWAPAQLQIEIAVGAWYSLWAETNLIFSARPQTLWRKLFERAEPAVIAQLSDISIEDAAIRPARFRGRSPACSR